MKKTLHSFFFIKDGVQSFHDFMQEVYSPAALSQARVSKHLQAQVNGMLQCTWFQLKHEPSSLTATNSGTRPGDSAADLLYGFLMTRYVTRLKEERAQVHLDNVLSLQWVPPDGVAPQDIPQPRVLDASWVDDLILLLQGSTAAVLIRKVQCVMTIAFDTAAIFGLQLNMNRDKTSVILALRGPGSRAVWSKLLTPDPLQPQIEFSVQGGADTMQVPALPDYVYLGVLQDQKGHPSCEVHRRLSSVHAIRKLFNQGCLFQVS